MGCWSLWLEVKTHGSSKPRRRAIRVFGSAPEIFITPSSVVLLGGTGMPADIANIEAESAGTQWRMPGGQTRRGNMTFVSLRYS